MDPLEEIQKRLGHFASLGFSAGGSHYLLDEEWRYVLTLKHSFDPATHYGEVICDAHLESGELMLTFSTPKRKVTISQDEFVAWLDDLKNSLLLAQEQTPGEG